MKSWYSIVTRDISTIVDCMDYYEQELIDARKELNIVGKKIERCSAMLPGIVEQRFSQLQDIEAILEYLNIEMRRIKTGIFRKYMEAHNRALSSRDAEKYADGHEDVISQAIIVNEFALLRNKFLGIMKGLDQQAWQIGNITRLRCAGLDDIYIQ